MTFFCRNGCYGRRERERKRKVLEEETRTRLLREKREMKEEILSKLLEERLRVKPVPEMVIPELTEVIYRTQVIRYLAVVVK